MLEEKEEKKIEEEVEISADSASPVLNDKQIEFLEKHSILQQLQQ